MRKLALPVLGRDMGGAGKALPQCAFSLGKVRFSVAGEVFKKKFTKVLDASETGSILRASLGDT